MLTHGVYDVWYSGKNAELLGNYAEKIQPIENSGLVGVSYGATHFSGTLLKTGMHILTSAHAVAGLTVEDFSSINIIFNVPINVDITPPVVVDITVHPSYSTTPNTANWINYDIAVIHLESAVDQRVSRYELYSGQLCLIKQVTVMRGTL
jgi:secreted trypsin-like serine protease